VITKSRFTKPLCKVSCAEEFVVEISSPDMFPMRVTVLCCTSHIKDLCVEAANNLWSLSICRHDGCTLDGKVDSHAPHPYVRPAEFLFKELGDELNVTKRKMRDIKKELLKTRIKFKAENLRLREALEGLADAFHGAWVDHGYDPDSLGEEYTKAKAALKGGEVE
jgi:hypothetical protein